jgi:HD-like signal output (HDOD) protein
MDKRKIFQSIADDLAKGELVFPTSARVALKVRQTLNDPDCHIEDAVKLVQAEPLLSARVIAMANSVAFNRSGREITDVRTAVVRLGFGSIRLLAIALVTRQLAGTVGAGTKQNAAAKLWEHSAHVAALARVIAQQVTQVDPETAMFAGIVHEIGGFYALSRAKDFPGLFDGDPADWIDAGEAEIGRAVLKVLEVPSPVMEAIESYWSGYLEMPPRTLGDTILICEELAKVPSPLRTGDGESPRQDIKAKIDLIVGEETLASILTESAVEVESLIAALLT